MKSPLGLLLKRRSHRINVTLPGSCISRLSDATAGKGTNGKQNVTVENVSKHGIGFRFIDPVKVSVNDVLRVKFPVESTAFMTVSTA
jgi:hypothetical protein